MKLILKKEEVQKDIVVRFGANHIYHNRKATPPLITIAEDKLLINLSDFYITEDYKVDKIHFNNDCYCINNCYPIQEAIVTPIASSNIRNHSTFTIKKENLKEDIIINFDNNMLDIEKDLNLITFKDGELNINFTNLVMIDLKLDTTITPKHLELN